MKMVKTSEKICSSCKYRINVEQKVSCNYLEVAGHSRIFENGKKAYDPAFCDKYEPGKPKRADIQIGSRERDEYENYKARKVFKERKIPTI